MACTHKRKPLFTSDYCEVCEDLKRPQLQIPVPEYSEPHQPSKSSPKDNDIDPTNCILPFDINAISNYLTVENHNSLCMFYKIEQLDTHFHRVLLWQPIAFKPNDIVLHSSQGVISDYFRVRTRSGFAIIQKCHWTPGSHILDLLIRY